ncbi:MAG: NAD(P)/FAD-dependent oxidoreductase [Gemmatimonadota bacterium]
MRRFADVGIVGAGPAGARAGELLAILGARVVMLDPKAPWEKPCGGGLTPSAFDEIPELEELKPEARAITKVRIETGQAEGFDVPLDRPMWILSRRTMSRWQLARAVAAGADHRKAKVRSAHRIHGGWRLETDEGAIVTPLVVGADGAASLVRRVAAPTHRVELAPTRVAYPMEAGPSPDTAILRFYSGLAGYLWDFPRPDHRSVGIGVPNGTWGRPELDHEVDEYRLSAENCNCSEFERAGAVIGTAQLGHGDFSRVAGRDYALLGDAAGFADPLTGEGIQNAIRSADLLVAAWRGSGSFQSFPSLACGAFKREFEVARFLRRFVFESDAGVRLIGKSMTSDLGYGLVAAITNAANEHNRSLLGFLWRWAKAFQIARREPSLVARTGRIPIPCTCGRAEPQGDSGECCTALSLA